VNEDDCELADITIKRAHAQGRDKMVGHLAMLAFAALVSGSYSIGAMAASHIGPGAINTVRFVFGICVMATAVALLNRGRIPAPREIWRYAILGFLMAVFFITMFIALRLTTPVATGAVFTLMPLMAAGFGLLFLGEKPRAIVLVGLVVAACGAVWVIFRGDVGALLAFDLGLGELIFLVGVASHAAYAPLVRRLNRGEALPVFTLWTLFATGSWIALYSVPELLETDWTALPPIVWIAVAYLAVFTTAGTTFLVQFGAMRLPAAKVMAYTYLTPSFIIVYEGLLGHGWASGAVAAGALVTMAALVVLAMAPDR